jgi:hypothetical protein
MIEQFYRQPGIKIPPSTHIFSSTTTKESVNEKKIHVVGVKFMPDTSVDSSITKVESGLEFILSHLSGPPFPRKISTALSENRQKEVDYKDTAILHYQGALWEDCRISAFYPGQKNPDLIFIDLDVKDFCSERALKSALTKILKRIKNKIGGHPTVLWSGRGFHIIQPINCSVDLDNEKEFADLITYYHDKEEGEVSKAFLQFASNYLTNYKRDKGNYTSLKSCLLRIPHSVNSKVKKEKDKDPEVKIIQKWDGFRPDVKLMLGSFHRHLVAEYQARKAVVHTPYNSGTYGALTIDWIEMLLRTPISDYRKHARDLILVPYLVVRKGTTDPNQIIDIIMQWADRCDELCSLEPSRRGFEKRIRYRIKKVVRNRIPPMRWDTLQQDNPELAQKLSMSSGGA